MTNLSADTSDIEVIRRGVGRLGFFLAVICLIAGLVMSSAGERPMASRLFLVAFTVAGVMPVKNVLAVLADEVRRRDWWFAALALAVLAELAWSVVASLR